MQNSGNKQFLFIETFLLGDLLYLGALISAVRAQLPDAQIELLTSNATRGFPFFERLNVVVHHFDFPWSRIGWHLHPFRLLQALAAFKRQFGRQFRDYMVLDPRGDLRHALTAWLLQPRRFIQYRSGAGWRDALRGASPRHIFISRQEFIRQIADECGLLPETLLPWPWLKDLHQNSSNKMDHTVLLAPESSFAFKYWKSDRWKQLANQLRRNGFRTTLVVHRGDAVSHIASDDFDEVWRGSLSDLGELLAGSVAVIAVDSFVGHLAAAISVPVVSLFGPQLPDRWRPWGEQTAVVMAPGYSCRPCGYKHCAHPRHNCMDAIQVEQVMQAFNGLIVGHCST